MQVLFHATNSDADPSCAKPSQASLKSSREDELSQKKKTLPILGRRPIVGPLVKLLFIPLTTT